MEHVVRVGNAAQLIPGISIPSHGTALILNFEFSGFLQPVEGEWDQGRGKTDFGKTRSKLEIDSVGVIGCEGGTKGDGFVKVFGIIGT